MTTLQFQVPDMACGACVANIIQAIKALDASAVVEANLQSKQVTVETQQPQITVAEAIANAGYTLA